MVGVLAWACIAHSLGACDTEGGEATDAGQDLVVDIRLPPPPGLCASIGSAINVGGPCETAAPCGLGGLCVRTSNEGSAACAQICVPGECTDMCGAGDCLEVATGGGPLMADLNADGRDEPLGICAQVEGSAAAYEVCGGGVRCADGLVCIGAGTQGGTCFPTCADPCGVYEGFFAECVGTSGGVAICVVPCDPADGPRACPEGLFCDPVVEGYALCAR